MGQLLSFENVKDTESTPLPAGEYLCVIDRTNFRPSSKGQNMIEVSYKVADGDHAGRLAFDCFVLDYDFAMSRLKQLVYALGLTSIELPDHMGSKENPEPLEDLHGLELYVKVAPDPKDNSRTRVKSVRSATGTPPVKQAPPVSAEMDAVPF